MISKRLSNRIKAAILSIAMTATVFVAPAVYNLSQVTAADISIAYDFVTTADKSETATNKKKINVSQLKGSDTITLNFETDYSGPITIGVYGAEISKDPYWIDMDQQWETEVADGKVSVDAEIPAEYKDSIKTLGIGVWYPKDGTIVTLASASSDSTTNPSDPSAPTKDPSTPTKPSNPGGSQNKPVSVNKKSGEWSIKDLGNGKALISSTLTAEINDPDMDYTLTRGYDEESYIDSETGESTYEEGMPINSQKFSFADFGLDDLTSVTMQSFNYTIKCDKQMNQFQYGGGINVELESPADTEYAKGKNGYWYNDQGDPDVEKFGEALAALGIDYHGAYIVENAGDYIEVVWDVPEDVQPYVSNEPTNTVGFQFWYADDANPENEEGYAAVDEVHLTSASCTYTRTLEVPYNKTENKKIGTKLTPGSDQATNQYKFALPELNYENRDILSAVKFNISSTEDMSKFVGGVGISVGNDNPSAPEGWFMPEGNITVLEAGKKAEIMWIIPEKIRKDVDTFSKDGNLLFGAWYAGENAPEITLDSIDFYEFRSTEEDLVVVPEKIEITAGETKKLDINVPGCSFISANPKIATAENDVITGVSDGLTQITVTTPEGQEKVITVKVNPVVTTAPVTTIPVTTTTKPVTTTTKPVTTTVKVTTTAPVSTTEPPEPIDWSRVLYGDVNLDEKVGAPDVVALNMYLLNPTVNKLNATAKENAQCVYDGVINMDDSTHLLNYCAQLVEYSTIGPQEGQKVPFE